jgi:hypothetical protein
MISNKTLMTDLTRILKIGTMSPKLREAVSETLKAVKAKDLDLAYQITVCKSLICGKLDHQPRRNAFREDHAANEKALGNSIYCIMDGIHFQLAMLLDKMPSGMMIFGGSPKGFVREEMKSSGTHPIVKRVIFEKARCAREVGLKT